MTVQLFDPAQLVKSGFMSGHGDASRSAWLARADLEYLFHQPLGVVAVDISHLVYPCLLTRILFVEDRVVSAALLTEPRYRQAQLRSNVDVNLVFRDKLFRG